MAPGEAGERLEPFEKVTVYLTERSAKCLDIRSIVNGDSRTDTINRAIQVYDYVETIREAAGLRGWFLRRARVDYR